VPAWQVPNEDNHASSSAGIAILSNGTCGRRTPDLPAHGSRWCIAVVVLVNISIAAYFASWDLLGSAALETLQPRRTVAVNIAISLACCALVAWCASAAAFMLQIHICSRCDWRRAQRSRCHWEGSRDQRWGKGGWWVRWCWRRCWGRMLCGSLRRQWAWQGLAVAQGSTDTQRVGTAT